MPVEEEKKTGETPAVPAPEASGAKSSVIKWAIVGAILLLFIGIEVGIAVFFVKKLKEPELVDTKEQDEDAKKQASLRVGATLAAPIEVTVNISGEEGAYVKCGVQLEYDPIYTKLAAELDSRKVVIKNIIIDIMSSSPRSELMTNEGKKAIREQIVAEVNANLPELGPDGKPLGKVDRSYFDSFMMQ
jgi:flagellar basal body-associated protein FliL